MFREREPIPPYLVGGITHLTHLAAGCLFEVATWTTGAIGLSLATLKPFRLPAQFCKIRTGQTSAVRFYVVITRDLSKEGKKK